MRATITILESNFMAHIDKMLNVLETTAREQTEIKTEARKLNQTHQTIRDNLVKLSNGNDDSLT